MFHSRKGVLFAEEIQEGEPERFREPFVGKILGEKVMDSETTQGESGLVKQLSDSSPNNAPDHDELEIEGETDCPK